MTTDASDGQRIQKGTDSSYGNRDSSRTDEWGPDTAGPTLRATALTVGLQMMVALANRIHILGASGTGTTTLAALIAAEHGHRHLDTDQFYWLPTDPPFARKRPPEERLELLSEALGQAERWVLSG